MHFLDSLQAATPLQLRPDRPASQHMLSYEQVVLEHSTSQLQQQKERQQLMKIDKLSEIIRDKERQLSEHEAKFLQRQLLFQIEIERLRRILSEWDGERRKFQQDSKAKERLYQTRLEELKTQLSGQFTQRVDQIRQQNKQDLERIRELYDIRIAKVHQESMKEEHRLRLAQMEADNKQARLQLTEAERQKLHADLLLKEDAISQLEEQLAQMQIQLRKIRDENERLAQDKVRQLEYLRLQGQAKMEEYQAMKALVIELQSTIEQLRTDKEQYSEARRKANEKITSLQIRCETLQQQVEQFRSRKTQHAFARQASQNTLSHQQSDRQQLSPVLKDSRSLPRARRPHEAETLQIANIEEQRPQQLRRIAELEEQVERLQEQQRIDQEQLGRHQQQLSKKDEDLKGMIRQVDILKARLQENQKELSKLQSSFSQQQSKLTQKDVLIQKLQAEIDRKSSQRPNNDPKMQRVWLQRIEKAEDALENLSQEWVKRERELAGLFKNIQSTYKQQLQRSKKVEQQLRKENQEITNIFMEKIKTMTLNK